MTSYFNHKKLDSMLLWFTQHLVSRFGPTRVTPSSIHLISLKASLPCDAWFQRRECVEKFIMSLYTYRPLSDVNEIRLLAILPGHFGDPIKCTLSTVCLDDEPAFEALSYTWGSMNKTSSLKCDSKSLKVTGNLYEGLQRLRRRKSIRVIWVDAVCINQDDVQERNQQILYMARIYKQAKQVVVWLGVTSDQNDLVPASTKKENWIINIGSSRYSSKRSRQLPGSWLQHFNRPWFLRVWIIQEVVFAQKVTVIHGRQKIPFRDFAKISDDVEARISLAQGRHNLADNSNLIDAIMSVYAIDDWHEQYRHPEYEGFDAYSLLQSTGGSRATDVRDKIYALLGLFPEPFREYIKPDYGLSIDQILLDVAKAFLMVDQDLSLLERSKPVVRRQAMPSWVPDFHGTTNQWGATSAEVSLWHSWTWFDQDNPHEHGIPLLGFSSGGVPVANIEQGGRALRVRGFRLSRIKCLSDHYMNSPDHEPVPYKTMLECLHAWYSILREHPQFSNDHLTRLPQFVDTVMMYLSTGIYAKSVQSRQSHGFSATAVGMKYRVFRSSYWNQGSDGSSTKEKRKQRYIKTSELINGIVKLSNDPANILKQNLTKWTRPQELILKKDRYPSVPAASGTDSESVYGNISSVKSSSATVSSPSSVSVSSIDSDDSDLLPVKTWKKSRNLARKNLKKPFKTWSHFAPKQYQIALSNNREKADTMQNDGDQDKAIVGSGSGSDADDEDLPPKDQGSEDDEKALVHPGSAELAEAATASVSPSLKGDTGSDEDIVGASTQANPEYIGPREEDLRYMHRAKPNEPPVQAPWIRPEPVSDPCTCILPSAIDYDNHLTESEDAQLFDPASPLMNTNRARRHFLSELEIDEAMNRKRFGYIHQDGRVFLGMFPTEAKEGDVVALLRGLRHPVVVREVELGRYEWVGGCHVNTLWDWDFLEKKVEEGGAAEGLEEIVLV